MINNGGGSGPRRGQEGKLPDETALLDGGQQIGASAVWDQFGDVVAVL
jgi:hypothetical protein